MYNKFIITLEGELRFGNVYLHRDLLPEGDTTCFGGGLWKIDNQRGCILLFGRSFDFGAPDFRYATWVNRQTHPGSLGYPMFFTRGLGDQQTLQPIVI